MANDDVRTTPVTETMCLAIPGRVESVFTDENEMLMGRINFGGVIKSVCLAYEPEAEVGDYVLVHVGFAISRVDERTAQQTLQTFSELGLLQEELEELRSLDSHAIDSHQAGGEGSAR